MLWLIYNSFNTSINVYFFEAHCVKDKQSIETKSAESSTFYLGKYKLKDLDEKEYVSAGVRQFIIHPNWNPFEERYTGDLAIALLYRTIQFTNDIIPLCMPPQRNNHEDIVHKAGLVAGEICNKFFTDRIYNLIIL